MAFPPGDLSWRRDARPTRCRWRPRNRTRSPSGRRARRSPPDARACRRSRPRLRAATRTARHEGPPSFREREERLDASEVAVLGPLQRALAAAHDDDRQLQPLAERGIVRRADARGARLAMGALDHVARKSLRGLRAP